MIESCMAIVLAKRAYKESDELIWLYSDCYGLISTVIHGINRKKSRYKGKIPLFAYIQADIKRRSGLSTIIDFKVMSHFDMTKVAVFDVLTYGSQISELIRKILPEQQKNICMFEEIRQAFMLLPNVGQKGLLVMYFQNKLLSFIGIEYTYDCCVNCQSTRQIIAFSSVYGGLICQKCSALVSKNDLVEQHKLKVLVAFSKITLENIPALVLDEQDYLFLSMFWQVLYEQGAGIQLKSQIVNLNSDKGE